MNNRHMCLNTHFYDMNIYCNTAALPVGLALKGCFFQYEHITITNGRAEQRGLKFLD
jgi:hypothetical protein